MKDRPYPQAIAPAVALLVNVLTGLGLSATPFGGSMVWVSNPAAEPSHDDPRGLRMSPGLRQAVQCRRDDCGCLGWFFVWHAPGEMPTYEYIAEASEIVRVAERIAIVLAVRPEAVS